MSKQFSRGEAFGIAAGLSGLSGLAGFVGGSQLASERERAEVEAERRRLAGERRELAEEVRRWREIIGRGGGDARLQRLAEQNGVLEERLRREREGREHCEARLGEVEGRLDSVERGNVAMLSNMLDTVRKVALDKPTDREDEAAAMVVMAALLTAVKRYMAAVEEGGATVDAETRPRLVSLHQILAGVAEGRMGGMEAARSVFKHYGSVAQTAWKFNRDKVRATAGLPSRPLELDSQASAAGL